MPWIPSYAIGHEGLNDQCWNRPGGVRSAGDDRHEPTDAGDRVWAEGFGLTRLVLTAYQECWRHAMNQRAPRTLYRFPEPLLTLA
jgi:hypothetical protein